MRTRDTPYRDWLGDAYDDLNDGVIEAFTDAADTYFTQKHHQERDPEHPQETANQDDVALSAILQSLLHEDTLRSVAQRARDSESVLTGWVRAQVALDVSESEVAKQAGLARDTVRRRLGK